MSEQNKHSVESKKPNYKARRLGAGLVASAAIFIPVTGNTSEAVDIPVRIAGTVAEIYENGNSANGRQLEPETFTRYNANGIKGGTFTDSTEGNTPEQHTDLSTGAAAYDIRPDDTPEAVAMMHKAFYPDLTVDEIVEQIIEPQLEDGKFEAGDTLEF